MNLAIRPPQPDEWRICRMLLPETFADAAQREYLLCVSDAAPRIAGAASFCRTEDAVTRLRIQVVPPLRRRGIGSQIVAHLAGGARFLRGFSEVAREPAVPAFCARQGFRRTDALTTVEGDIAPMRAYLAGLRARMPADLPLALVPLAGAPAAQVAALHAQLVAHQSDLDPWRALLANAAGMDGSPVVLCQGRVAGILLWQLQGATAVVRSRAAAPGPHARWVNVLLLAAGLDAAAERGARCACFSYTDANRDTRKLAARFRAEVKSVVVEYTRANG